ncbi:LBP_cg2779 family protein [Fructilactobacillus fructivorans]|uniref:Uncharacterized protein n=1 Tax=Fructilactobacillus fructivorans TaxID=1614 RepID=A0A0C1PQ25_9LACO|nr:LBP_cg2779 family protein [Fructilactobacillus fructivorans]KID41991.1 hypothetical protein LfDm3_0659 [Fructilactobacillus fructivorans]KRK57189.1 hypothetical protein FC73_GL001227 [Fructilactobacillus fructivorans]KRN12098.1 hypothetical protein IV37_GL001323 [Fructilactobacillus fructivorans]KRN40433.1 hypothetical protein IV51_GL000139 [Fructilactobacillus fructivorans]KRN42777.1 hypothetical protein IV48_GL001183 [Fructilactobacillus fructivorans]
MKIGEEFSQVATDLIKFQEKHDIPDNQMAVDLHMTVERFHAIKSMQVQPTQDEVKIIKQFIVHNK